MEAGTLSLAEEKKLKKVIHQLPFDCWGMIILYLGSYGDYKVLLFSIKGLYEYIKDHNSYCTENMLFKVVGLPKPSPLNFVRHVRVGDNGEDYMYQENINDHIKMLPLSYFIHNFQTCFPKLKTFIHDPRHFEIQPNALDLGKKLQKNYDFLKNITLSFNSNATVNINFERFPSLETLNLSSCVYKFGTTLSLVIFGESEGILPVFKNLSLTGFSDVKLDPILVPILASKLISLDIRNTPPVFTEYDFPNLESLSLHDLKSTPQQRQQEENREEDERRTFDLVIEKLPKLRTIDVSMNNIEESNDTFTFAGNWPFNQEINLVVKLILDFSKIGKNLEEAKLSGLQNMKTEDFKFLKNLKTLFFNSTCYGTNEENLDCSYLPSLNYLQVRSSPTGSSTLRVFNLQSNLKKLHAYVENSSYDQSMHSVIVENIESVKYTLEVLSVGFVNSGFNLGKNIVKSLKGSRRRFCDFQVLKEIEFYNYKRNKEVLVDNNKMLKKITFYDNNDNVVYFQSEKDDKRIVLSNLPSLEFIELNNRNSTHGRSFGGGWNNEWNDSGKVVSYMKIEETCPKIRKLALRKQKYFPEDIKKENLEELEITDCGVDLIASLDRVIDGRNVFKRLKHLKISQNWDGIGSGENCVTELIGLDKLWTLQIRSKFIQFCGISKVEGLSENVDVELTDVYKSFEQGKKYTSSKSMDKKRFMELISFNPTKSLEEKSKKEYDNEGEQNTGWKFE